MSLKGIVENDYGQTIQLTVIDIDTGEAADVSAYNSAQQLIFTDPSGNDTTVSAGWATDGTDGVIEYTLQDGNIDEAGDWYVRARLTSATARLTTLALLFEVKKDETS